MMYTNYYKIQYKKGVGGDRAHTVEPITEHVFETLVHSGKVIDDHDFKILKTDGGEYNRLVLIHYPTMAANYHAFKQGTYMKSSVEAVRRMKVNKFIEKI